jgi:hypothetical protein
MNAAVGVSVTSAAICLVCSACLTSLRGLEHLRRLGGLDLAVDELQAGRVHLVAEHVGLQIGRAVLGHDRAVLQRHQRLLDVVVAV